MQLHDVPTWPAAACPASSQLCAPRRSGSEHWGSNLNWSTSARQASRGTATQNETLHLEREERLEGKHGGQEPGTSTEPGEGGGQVFAKACLLLSTRLSGRKCASWQ